jgi:hypothetical protein
MNRPDLDALRLSDEDMDNYWGDDKVVKAVRVNIRSSRKLFLSSITIDSNLVRARSLGSVAFILYQLIHTAHQMNPNDELVTLPPKLLEPFKIRRQAISVAIKSLEVSGLIEIQRRSGHKNHYRLLSVE